MCKTHNPIDRIGKFVKKLKTAENGENAGKQETFRAVWLSRFADLLARFGLLGIFLALTLLSR